MLGRKRDPKIAQHMRGYQRAKKEYRKYKELQQERKMRFHELHLNALGCTVESAAPPNNMSAAHRERFEKARAKAAEELREWQKAPPNLSQAYWFGIWPAPGTE
ncbi:MAG: hypothetical protein AAGB19_14445 [Cyanobacteria bacterium P01_F01_bin.3]